MTYRCGLGPGIARMMGVPENPYPTVTCDGCGKKVQAVTKRGLPPVWLLDGKPVPGWRCKRNEDGTRVDRCQDCKTAPSADATQEGKP